MSHFLSKSTYEIIEVSGVLRSCDTFVISSVFILSPFTASFIAFCISSCVRLRLSARVFKGSGIFSE